MKSGKPTSYLPAPVGGTGSGGDEFQGLYERISRGDVEINRTAKTAHTIRKELKLSLDSFTGNISQGKLWHHSHRSGFGPEKIDVLSTECPHAIIAFFTGDSLICRARF